MTEKLKEYHVRYEAILDGSVNVLAKNKKDAYIKVRSALEPKIDGVFKDNDTLFLAEKFDINSKLIRQGD